MPAHSGAHNSNGIASVHRQLANVAGWIVINQEPAVAGPIRYQDGMAQIFNKLGIRSSASVFCVDAITGCIGKLLPVGRPYRTISGHSGGLPVVRRVSTLRARSSSQMSPAVGACVSLRKTATCFSSGDRAIVRDCPGSPAVSRTFPARSNHVSWLLFPGPVR